MLDTCTVTRAGGEPMWDPDTGSYTPPMGGSVYTGPCRIKPREVAQDVQAGEQEVGVRRYDVALPHDTATVVQVGDVLTVTASSDGWLVGRVLAVTGVEIATARTARWLTVEDGRG